MANRGPSPEIASARNVDTAGRGKLTSTKHKIAQVAAYIQANAASPDAIATMRCPSPEVWARCATGRFATLPNTVVLGIFANEVMRQQVEARLKRMRRTDQSTITQRWTKALMHVYFEAARATLPQETTAAAQ